MVPVRPMVGKPGLPGSFQAGLAVLPDLLTTAGVFVVRGHISHAGVQPDRIPVNLQMIKLGPQDGGFGDLQQVRELGLQVPEECFDPCLIGRCAGSPEMHGNCVQGHEFPGRPRCHLRAVVRHREQDRSVLVINGRVRDGPAVGSVDAG